MIGPRSVPRVVPAVHATRAFAPDPDFERGLAAHLRESSPTVLAELTARFAAGTGEFDRRMRRVLWRAMARGLGDGLEVGLDVRFSHLETFEIGHGVTVGDQVILQGRFDGTCVLGDRVWIGAQAFLDARALVVEASVGIGPGVRILGSTHTGHPAESPVIETDLVIAPVHIGAGADIGVNAVILPGIAIGAGAIVGAGAVVTRDVPPRAVVAGVPARRIGSRDDPGGRGSRRP